MDAVVFLPVVTLTGTLVDRSSAGFSFKHKLPRSSKEIVTFISTKDVILVTDEFAAFHADGSKFKQEILADTVSGIETYGSDLLTGTTESGTVYFSGKFADVSVSAETLPVKKTVTRKPKATEAKKQPAKASGKAESAKKPATRKGAKK